MPRNKLYDTRIEAWFEAADIAKMDKIIRAKRGSHTDNIPTRSDYLRIAIGEKNAREYKKIKAAKAKREADSK